MSYHKQNVHISQSADDIKKINEFKKMREEKNESPDVKCCCFTCLCCNTEIEGNNNNASKSSNINPNVNVGLNTG